MTWLFINLRIMASVLLWSLVATSTQSTLHFDGKVFSLLADGHLFALDMRDGSVIAEHALLPKALEGQISMGHLIASSRDRQTIFVLVPSPSNTLAVIDAESGRIRASHALDDGDYRALDVGPVTGRVYLFGNYSQGQGLIFTILDNIGMETVETLRMTLPPFNWWIYQVGVSADEQRVFVSYHGSPNFTGGLQGTGGIDWFNRGPDGWIRCLNRSGDGAGCIRAAHGGFARYLDGLLVATGTNVIHRVNASGTTAEDFDTGLKNNHLMEFALDTAADKLYAVGSCDYVPGFSVVDLKDGTVFVKQSAPGPPSSTTVCGERLAIGPNNLIVVAQTQMSVPNAGRRGALLFIDGRTGGILQSVPTPSEPLDTIVVTR
jgi:outer membrane protein assembly factor BamB